MDYTGIPLATLITGLILGGLVVYFLYRKSKKYTYPKGPRSIPLLGNLHQMLTTPGHVKLSQWAYEYGPMYKVNFGTSPALLVNDLKLMKELFSIYPASTGKYNTDPFILPFQGYYGFGCTDGPQWLEQRQFCVKSLKNLGFGKGSEMDSILSHEANQLVTMCRDASSKGSFHLAYMFRKCVVNTILVLITGETIAPDDNEFCDVMTKWVEVVQKSIKTGLAFMPWLKHIAPTLSGYKDMQVAGAAIHKYVRDSFERSAVKTSDPQRERETLVDALLEKMESEKNPSSTFYGDEGWKHCLGSVIVLFIAGGETTSTTLEWLIFYLCAHPDVQSKLQNEIDEVIGSGNVSVIDKLKMPYTEAVILETFRKSSILPLGILHESSEDLSFHEYNIRKGTLLIYNLYHVHHNTSIWRDPDNFRPERFLEDDSTLKENVIPFGIGRRQCMAEHLARDILFMFVVKLLQKFTFEPDSTVGNRKEYLKQIDGILLLPQMLPVRAVLRE